MIGSWRGRGLRSLPFITREESRALSGEVPLVEALGQLAARCREALGICNLPKEVAAPYSVAATDRILHVVEAGEVTLPPPTPGRELRIKAMVAGVVLRGPCDDVEEIALGTRASRTLIGDGVRWCIH